jgi:ABC-type dipeptide/oligopeptide/nickel transport system permease subunit
VSSQSVWRIAARRLLRHWTARVALGMILALAIGAIVGPLLLANAGHQLNIVDLKNAPPSRAHLFGTDQYSRDLLARVLSGARVSLAVALLSVAISMTIGTAYGLIAGYVGGRVDGFMMRLLDGFLSIPRVLLLIAVLALRSSVPISGLIFLIGATGWFAVSRLVRAETMSARRLEYVEAARALGTPDTRILWRHILPNVAAPVIVTATMSIGNVIALEAGLSYLGIGAREPQASWGSIFFEGVEFFAGNWWVVFFPGVAIVLTVLAFNVLGDALRDVLDPRQLHGADTPPVSSRALPLSSRAKRGI